MARGRLKLVCRPRFAYIPCGASLPYRTGKKRKRLKEDAMSKTVMRLYLPEPKLRKRMARAVQKHRDKKKYTRQCKHKAAGFGGLCFFTKTNHVTGVRRA